MQEVVFRFEVIQMFTKISMSQGLALAFFIGMLFWGCSGHPTSPPKTPFHLTTAEKNLIESDNRFGVKLFQKIIAAQEDKNIFISPLSVAMSLGMTHNGAAGDTREAMGQTLELSGLTIEEVNESYQHLIELLTQLDPQVQFQIANSIWYREEFQEPEIDFLNACNQYFGALVTGLDFSEPDAAAIINAWVDESTNGRIGQIVVDPINPWYVMFLINAIYFKGSWTHRFDEEWTQNEYFTLPDGTEKMCPMMAQRGLYTHYSGDDFRALDLPYGGMAYRMTILLPGEGVDLDSLIAEINPNGLNFELMDDLLSLTSRDSLDIFIPKFTLEYGIELKDVLSALGMDIAFTPGADFTNMYASGGVWIDELKHKTFVEVNEEGTQASAVASSIITSGVDDTVFRVNRPFAFVIRENYSQTILFIGKIVDPTVE
jgi:serine protease inhibitor